MLKSYSYRLYPNPKQVKHFVQVMGAVRYLYNKGLEERVKTYEQTGKGLTYFTQTGPNGLLACEKAEHEWLWGPAHQSLQQALRNLDNAFTRFFRKQAKFPNFKKKSGHQSVQYTKDISVDFANHKVRIPKLGKVNAVFDREFSGKIKTCTVSKTPTGKFFISILVDDGAEAPIKAPINPATSVGIDLGIKDFAILSDGTKVSNPKYLRKNLDRLKVLQRRASKKQKGSKNRQKANKRVAKLYEQITNQRKDFLNKLSTKIISENQTVILEDLNIEGMLRNHKLAQAISDVSWGKFVRQLTYKAEWAGKNVIYIGRFDASTKTCSDCGAINQNLTLADREWDCPCGSHHDRDINAAINVKKFGLIRSKEGHDLTVSVASLNSMKETLKQILDDGSNAEVLSGSERPVEPVEMPSCKSGRRSRKSSSASFGEQLKDGS
jgi:putative transposase